MRAYDLIKRKRDGGRLAQEEIAAFLDAYTRGDIPDYQASAMLMAIFFRGMDAAELAAWTRAMLESGEVLDLSDIPGVKVDKHSTGGVGDKVSIPLVPLVMACGVKVPMIAGRGLGHTGGTIDKLEAIPGFSVELGVDRFRRQVSEIGAALIGQTAELAPADRKLYALRDATATVESIPLISSSILSKKLAEGCDALVLDVKVGQGAFMKDLGQARELARTMVDLGRQMGRRMVALLTGMEQPLGRAVGNALEVVESIEVLRGGGPEDLEHLTVELGAEMLVLGEAVANLESGRDRIRAAIADGSGLRAFEALVEAQGGDPRVVREPERLPRAPRTEVVRAPSAGYVVGIQAEEVGLAAMTLGAGRSRKEDPIDPAVGFVLQRKVGDRVEPGEPLAIAHLPDGRPSADALSRLLAAFTIAEEAPRQPPLVLERIA
ncbi:thymidine phosphorylase [Vulgatibacter incomptus]|uniref:thymidine phosphorylase n=1 Tax=Vulgatibacter incomptus TaxID=1391653 RepID=A0A0K1P9T6_9BACT|nr:thymidine phosphorylase [Vulgatibacter incomptus]AKU90293.1 Pyrimidine-nucleoside phosphorylase [Vulgatibacter incomptus]